MAKKDFTNINTNRVYSAIHEATAEPETQQVQGKRKARKTYSDEELAKFADALSTAGRKGAKLPRMNMAFHPAIYDYIQTMSRARGENMTTFVNLILREYMENHMDVYNKAKEFIAMLDKEDI